ncbi:MAG: calcium-binding protein, partial [Roseobacter sp.]
MPSISITNASFEGQDLSNGDWTYGGAGSGQIDGWTITSGSGGVYDPDNGEIGNTSGSDVAYLYDAGSTLEQQLGYTYDANEEITFSIDVGDPDYEGAQNYRIEIVVGTTVIGATSGNTGDNDTLQTAIVVSNVQDTALNDQPVILRLVKIGNDNEELFFDNAQASYEVLTSTVDGTAGADAIGAGFVDVDGDAIDGADGDVEVVDARAGDDTINAGAGADTILAGDDADTIQLSDGFGDDIVFGGEGGTDQDALDASALTTGATVTMTGAEAGTLTDGTDTATFSQIEDISLTNQGDIFDGTAIVSGVDISGGAGDDTMTGGSGEDTLDGGSDDDTIEGGAGNDDIVGGDGSDTIYGDSPPEVVIGEVTSFSWQDQGIADDADIKGGITGNTVNGDIQVKLSITQETNFTEATMDTTTPLYDFDNRDDTSSIYLRGGSSGTDENALTASIDFTDPGNPATAIDVEDVSFGLFDIDNFADQFLDQVIITAYDANGNQVPVTITPGNATTITSSTGPGGTATATATTAVGGGGSSDADDIDGYAQVTVAGPVSS